MIKFYSPKEVPYGCFSNFYRRVFEYNGKKWPTSEHAYQAMKYTDPDRQEFIRSLPKPKLAAIEGRNKNFPLRDDWEQIKYETMKQIVLAKFSQHPDLRSVLLCTANSEIVEDSPIDYIWGCGKDGTGTNWLGKVLMEVREIIADELHTKSIVQAHARVMRRIFAEDDAEGNGPQNS